MKLRQRMLLVILGSIVVILAGLLTYVGASTHNNAVDSATSLASTSGEKIAATVQKDMQNAMDASRTIAETLEGMKQENITNRSVVSAMLKRILEDNPSFLGTWTLWEPNAFDGLDQQYANTEGTDQSGRLITYWTRTGSALSLTISEGYEQPGVGDYYLLARNSGNEAILNPFIYKIGNEDVMMTSLTVPIKIDGKVVGVAGVDLRLDQLQALMKQFKLYSTGFAAIYSHDGSIVTSPNADEMGKKINDVFKDDSIPAIVKSIHEGAAYKANVGGSYKVFTPIQIGRTKTPWSVGITIPMKEITAQSNQLLYSTIVAGIVALLVLAGVILLVTNAIVKPIAGSVAIGEYMAKGDFTKPIPPQYLKRKDEIGILARVFDNIMQSMRAMIGQVGGNSAQVAAAAQQISGSAEELAGGSSSQAQSAQTVNELFKELSTAINAVAASAEQAAELSNQTSTVAVQGGQVVKQSIEGMTQVNQQMARLEEDSNKIGEIIEVIDEIAEQTNLLALNAAIEAARAGEQGRGFAVVADEVRKLAERSGEATKQITGIIKVMQQNTRHSVTAVGEGVVSSQKTGEAFEQIITMINETAHKVTEIAAASEQQAAQSSEVLGSIESISAAAQEASASSEETAATAQSLTQLADQLNKAVAIFKIN